MYRTVVPFLLFSLIAIFPRWAEAQYLDQIGLTILRATTTNLNGAGVTVGQPEASLSTTSPIWEVNPGNTGHSASLFTWIAGNSPYLTPPNTSSTFPNSLGSESTHADTVGDDFYSISLGVATNVAHVNNYDADTFYNYYIGSTFNHTFTERIVNQSFTFNTNNSTVDQDYDNYAAKHNVLFISGAGFNGGPIYSPATCYNGIGVGVYNNPGSPYGPTPDGRSKPDIVASGYQDSVTSYATPLVSGSAALLMQAGARGDGGGDTTSATDIRTLKALLLNGAVKPPGWTNSPSTPLHYRYGAGVVNVLNSYVQLAVGKHGYVETSSVSSGNAHPPGGASGNLPTLNGWDFNTISSGPTQDEVNHYYFDATNAAGNFTLTATLTWNRQYGQSSINNLNLYLYNCANSNLVACSTSLVDNVEHIFLPKLAPGRYDLQVWKASGLIGADYVSSAETYALAYAFTAPRLNIAAEGVNTVLTWPAYPDRFHVETTTSLISPAWSSSQLPSAAFTNGQHVLVLDPTNTMRFFRLRQTP